VTRPGMYARWGSASKRRSLPSPRESLSGSGKRNKPPQNCDGAWDWAGNGWGRFGSRKKTKMKMKAFWSDDVCDV
jgi:hypothetical protein